MSRLRTRLDRLERKGTTALPDHLAACWGSDPSTLTDAELDAMIAYLAPQELERIRSATDEELHAMLSARRLL